MKVKVSYRRQPTKARLLSRERYVCPWCWASADEPKRCKCGAIMEKEHLHIFLKAHG
ncbi:MAG: hypothetical protein WC497_02805 [Patescibacteria group bacterium]